GCERPGGAASHVPLSRPMAASSRSLWVGAARSSLYPPCAECYSPTPAVRRSSAMPPFPRPEVDFPYDPQVEIEALRDYERTKDGRAIPRKTAGRLLVATWNIANLGRPGQERRDQDYKVIAELISWFDLVAIQEVNDNLDGLRGVMHFLPDGYR